MKIDTTLGTYDEVFANSPGLMQEIAATLNAYITDFDKDVCVVPRRGEKSMSYGIGTKKMSESYCYIMPQKDYVNLGFPHGALLNDEHHLLEGTGKKYRHIKIRTNAQTKDAMVRAMIKQARDDRIKATGVRETNS